MRKIGLFNIGRLGLVKSAGTGKTDINKVIEKWIPKHMVFWYDMSKPVDVYTQNFNDWQNYNPNSVSITNNKIVVNGLIDNFIIASIGKETESFSVFIEGLGDKNLVYRVKLDENSNQITNIKLKDGENVLPHSFATTVAFMGVSGVTDYIGLTITQLPSGQSVPTNEILKANPYLQDFSGNNRPLKLNNFLFAAMSGVGGYDISSTNILPDRANVTVTDNRIIHITKKLSTTDNMVNIVPANSNPTHKFKVTGLSDGRQVSLVNRNGGFYTFDNGEHEVTLTYPEGTTSLYNAIGVTGDIGDMDVTIEFLPKYPNALITDGVDDYGVVENLQQGVKVLFYTCNNFRLSQILYDQRKVGYDKIQSSYFSIFTEANTIAYNARNVDGKTYIDGVLNETTIADNLLGKKTIITIINSSANSERTGKPSFFSTYNNLGYFANLAFYNSIGFDSVPTKQNDGFTEQDLIDYYIPKAIVTITVVDVSGSPIQDATVTVGGVQYKTLSDGTVKVRGMANGTMSLSVKKDGYMPFSDNSWKLADSRITLEVLRNTVITENGYSILLENDGLILTE